MKTKKLVPKSSYPLYVIFIVFIMVFLISTTACYQFYVQRFKQELELGSLLTKQASQAMSLWLDDQVFLAKSLSSNALVRDACLQPKNLLGLQAAQNFLEDIHKERPDYTSISIIPFFTDHKPLTALDEHNNFISIASGSSLVDSIGGIMQGKGSLDDRYTQAIYKGQPAYISETNPMQGLPQTLIVATPIYAKDHIQLVGCLTFEVKLEVFTTYFSDTMTKDSSGRIEIMDCKGHYLTPSNHYRSTDPEPCMPVKNILHNLKNNITQFAIQEDDKTWEYSASPIKTAHSMDAQWWTLFKRDRQELYNSLIWPMASLGLFCLVIFVLLIIMSFKINKAVVQYINANNQRKEAEIHRIYTQSISYGIILLDYNNDIVDINPAAKLLLGDDSSQLAGKPLKSIFLNPLPSSLEKAIANKTQAKLSNIPLQHFAGNTVVFDIIFNLLEFDDKIKYTITLIPIPATRDYEEQMRAIYTASPDSYITFDEYFKIIDCTKSTINLFQAKSKRDVQDNFEKFSAPQQENSESSNPKYYMRKALEQGFVRFKWMHQSEQGNLIPTEITLIRFLRQGHQAGIACIRDLRTQQKYELELTKERSLLRSIIDSIQGIIFLRDADERYILINNAYTTILGLTTEQVQGKTESDILPPDLAKFCQGTDAAAYATKGPYYFEQKITLVDETQRDYLFCKEVLYAPDKTRNGILTVGIDITIIKEAENQIALAKLKAEEANFAKSEFLARMSHEIRTPMNAILGMSYLVLQTNLSDKQSNYLVKIQNAAEHLMEILNSILDFSKIESGKMFTEEISFNLSDTMYRVETILAEKAKQTKLDLYISWPKNHVELMGDPLHLGQVLINLGSNALKFTNTGGVYIEVAAEAILEDRIFWHFSVMDTGIGMTKEQMGKLFQPFTQASNTTARLYGGTGLGLSICKNLVEIMGGRIWAESVSGVGSTFHFSLWLKKAIVTAPIDFEEDTPELMFFPSSQVLLVEDNTINQEIVLELLKMYEINADVVSNGQEAVEAVQAKKYDLVFMDIQMPVMDGIKATEIIRSSNLPYATTIPIVAMTANAMLSDRQKTLEAGMNDHLSKPIEIHELNRILLRWLAKTSS